MRDRWILVGLIALLVLTLGCLGGDDPMTEDAEPSSEKASPTDEDDEHGRADQTAGETNDTGSPRGEADAAERGPIVHHLNATFPVEAANLGTSFTERSLEAEVPSDAQAIVAELRWEGTADLDLALWSPQFCQDTAVAEPFGESACRIQFYLTGDDEHAFSTDRASPAIRQAQLAITVDAAAIAEEACEEDECSWTAHVNPNAAVETRFELRVSVFPHAAPADGYSAFDGV